MQILGLSRFIISGLLGLLLLIPVASAHAKEQEVLVLHSYHQGFKWTRDMQAGIESILKNQDVSLYVSYLDSKRFFTDEYMGLLTEAFARKFSHREFDLVIVTDNNALTLAKTYGQRLFPNTPIVFTGVNNFTPALIEGMAKVTGVVETPDLAETLTAALSLKPLTSNVYVIVDDTHSGKLIQRDIERMSSQFYPKIHILHDESFLSLKQKVSEITDDAIILYTVFARDRDGIYIEYDKMLEALFEVAKVPMFGAWDYTLGYGIVGGKMISGFSQGERAARKALDILHGVPIEALPIETKASNQFVFDALLLEHWQLDPEQLPKNAFLTNQPDNEFSSYRDNFFFVLVVVLSLCVIIALLQFNLLKQKRVESELRASRTRFSALFHEAFQFIILLDDKGRILQANKAALQLLNLNEVDVIGEYLWESPWWRHDLDEQQKLVSAIDMVQKGDFVRYESQQVNASKQQVVVDLSLKPVRGAQGVEMILLEGRDINSIKRAEIELRESEARYRVLHDENPFMLLTINNQGLVLSCNRYGALLLGYAVDDVVGKNITLLHTESHDIGTQIKYLNRCASHPDGLQTRQIQYQTRLGKNLWLNETTRKVPGKEQFFLVCEDITETKELSEQLAYQASHDFLTGLNNRSFFETQLQKYIDKATESEQVHALMYLDMDQFKVINDTCGHSAGDEVLKQLSTLLTDSLPTHALLARLGGDEFGVIIADCQPDDALAYAHGIIAAIAEHHFISEEKTFSLGVSIGLVEINQNSGNRQHVLSCADTACYAAKDEGRNRVHVFKQDDQEVQRRHGEMQWVNKVQQALREQRFCLYAQPIKRVNGKDGSDYLHYEVLTRMIDENGKLAPPGLFIPAAENYNLADKLDKLIIDKTLAWLKGHPDHVAKLDQCSINLSGQSIGNKEFVEYLVKALVDSELPLYKICFEVTETVAIANFSHASFLLKELKKLGCKLALDDFGTGLSSFGYLKRLPVDYLKIDGLFVRDIADDEMDYAMVRSINEVSQLMGKQTIAECVEDERVMMRLAEIGVDFAQGYHLGKPMPIEMMALVSLAME
ncbi:EAL domain-containing protein [Motilimonas eburnea]|uniref:EAL domain-containing protein n=1 Tax=Motilimonas eburnea TaxID=1737488 RepID=UPI001E3A258E|nr:EAL domain-containing protein [Motilimonas eburnea]MCE2572879.1 EAL domain-containing protein [Motilimonas eburnea]